MEMKCEHCRRSRSNPVVIKSGTKEKAFCSADCVMQEEGGRGDLQIRMAEMRDALIARIEKSRHSRVITLIHRHDMKANGEEYITIENSEDILDQIRNAPPGIRIDFIVHCPGGMALPAEQIALALKSHRGGVTAIVPYYAMSGGSLVCLAADEIVMEPFSVLGPLDPQIDEFPSPSLIKLQALKKARFISDDKLILADIAGKYLAQMRLFVASLLEGRMTKQKAAKIADYMTGGYLTHDAAITAKELTSLGIRVKEGVPSEIYEFMKLNKLVQRSPLFGSGPVGYMPPSHATPMPHK